MKHRMACFLLGATLALGFALSAYIVAQAALKLAARNNIRVKGSAMQVVNSDYGVWTGWISVRSPELKSGYAKLESDRALAVKFLTGLGFSADEFQFDAVNVSEVFRRNDKGETTNAIEGYELSLPVNLESAKVELVARAAREFATLIGEGVYAQSSRASYTISDLDKYKLNLLAEATRNATVRAETLAANSGGRVGQLLSASQGIYQITAPNSGAMSDYGEYDKSTIAKEVKAVVTLEFKVE